MLYTCGNCVFVNQTLKIDSEIILFLNCGYISKHFPFPYAGARFQVAGGVPREPFAGSLQALIVLKLRSSLSCARLKQRPQIECSPVCERKHSAFGLDNGSWADTVFIFFFIITLFLLYYFTSL